MNRLDACRSCHHSVVWLEHVVSKKKAPIDFAPNEDGNAIAVDADGDQTIIETAVAYKVLRKGEYAPMPRHMPHFATCSAAKQFRGKGRAA